MAKGLGSRSETKIGVIDRIKYYVFFCKPVAFISVLIFSNSFVDNGVIGLLLSYLMHNWEVSLLSAAAFVAAQQGLSSVLMIIISHLADVYLGLFKFIIVSSILLIVALVLLWILTDIRQFPVVMVLIAFGEVGRDGPLREFLTSQLRNKDKDQNKHNLEGRAKARSTTWWKVWRFVGSVAATVALGQVVKGNEAIISAIVMGVALLIFLSGFTFYYRQPNQTTPLTIFLKVLRIAISKRRLPYPSLPNGYYENDTDQLRLMPRVRFVNWIDKAAVIESLPLTPNEQEETGKLCIVREVKLILRMIPMWGTFIIYSFIGVTGSTLFYEQAHNLDNGLVDKIITPLSTFYLIRRCANYAISYVCDSVIQEIWSKNRQLLATKIRIGIGMGCGCLACYAAWILEVQRLKRSYKLQDEEAEIDMSIFLLTPQLFFLGLMEGLSEDGLNKFLHLQVGTIMATYADLFNEFAMGIGKLASIFWLLAFRFWFNPKIDKSKVVRYYLLLAILGVVNLLVVYGSVSIFGYKNAMGDHVVRSSEDPVSRVDIEGIQLEENSNGDDLSRSSGYSVIRDDGAEPEGSQIQETIIKVMESVTTHVLLS